MIKDTEWDTKSGVYALFKSYFNLIMNLLSQRLIFTTPLHSSPSYSPPLLSLHFKLTPSAHPSLLIMHAKCHRESTSHFRTDSGQERPSKCQYGGWNHYAVLAAYHLLLTRLVSMHDPHCSCMMPQAHCCAAGDLALSKWILAVWGDQIATRSRQIR